MLPEKRSRPKRSGIEGEEERAWIAFYRRVHVDVDLAVEVLAQLDHDPEMKRSHLALYLSCKESLRHAKARQARHKRIAGFLRWLARTLFVMPWHAMQVFGGSSRDLTLELLPENTGARPATRRYASSFGDRASSSANIDAFPRRRSAQRREATAPTSGDEAGPALL